jgi:hypothetical protein
MKTASRPFSEPPLAADAAPLYLCVCGLQATREGVILGAGGVSGRQTLRAEAANGDVQLSLVEPPLPDAKALRQFLDCHGMACGGHGQCSGDGSNRSLHIIDSMIATD